MASPLPRFIGLKAHRNSKYLSFVREEVKEHGLLKCSGEEVVSPFTKFEAEASATDIGLVHLKSCYNNKYFVMDSSSHEWIAATAENPNEDHSASSCTLFKPIVGDEAKTLQLVHVQLDQYVCLSDSGYIFPATSDGVSSAEVFGVTDLESLFVLPKHVAFSALNGHYLSSCLLQGHEFLQFLANEASDPAVANEVFITSDGSNGVKATHFSKFWKRNKEWVLAIADDANVEDPDSLFWPHKVDKAAVALRNLGNNKFCKRFTSQGLKNVLGAVTSDLSDEEARLQVSEMVTSREIYDVIYHVPDKKVYNQRVVTLGTQTQTNTNKPTEVAFITFEHSISCTLQFPYENTLSMTWNSSVTSKLFDTVTLKAGTPTIPGGKSSDNLKDFEGNYTWGETVKTSTNENEEYKGDIPGSTRRTVNFVATIVSYDVPFSYTQRDTLVNGEQVVYQMEDGIYTGDGIFKVEFVHSDEHLLL